MTATLFATDPKARWTGSRAVVPLDPSTCPNCGAAVQTVCVEEPTLFRHGGYGATRRTTSRLCVRALARQGCRFGLTADVTEVNPRQR